MILHFLDLREKDEEELILRNVPVFGIGFQGDSEIQNPERLISYTVTTDYWNKNYNEDTEEEE